MGFGDFAHDVGEAGVALRRTDLEGIDQGGEAYGAYGDGAFAGRWIAGVEAVELEEEALGGASEIITNYVDAHLFGRADLGLEVLDGASHAGFGVADAQDGVAEDLPEGLLAEAGGVG